MRNRVVFALAFLLLTSVGCTASKFDSVIGHPKSYAVEVLGIPAKTATIETGGEVWGYPASSPTASAYGADHSPDAPSPLVQGVSEAITETIVRKIFGDGPIRLVFFDEKGIARRWELKS